MLFMKIKENRLVRRLTDTSPIDVFCVFSIGMFAALIGRFIISKGVLIDHYFFYDTRDTGMDFFHSIEYVRGAEPYAKFSTLYPPLANLLFYFFYSLIPRDLSNCWEDSYLTSVLARGSEMDLRTHQAPMIIFLVFLMLCCWLVVVLVTYALQGKPRGRANLVALCILLSPGMLFALERGNIVLLVVPLTLFFVLFRNARSAFVRELSLISLAIAAGLKLYPAFFGILLLRDKKYGAALRAIVYGILSVIVPFLFFKEGLQGISIWLTTVFQFNAKDAASFIGTGFANILYHISGYAENYLGIEMNTAWFSKAGLVLAVILLISALLSKKDWQSLLAITMALTIYSSQGEYIYSFFCIPAVLFLRDERKIVPGNWIPFCLIMLMSANLPVFNYAEEYTYPNNGIRQMILLMLCAWCIVDGLVNLDSRRRRQKNS